MTRDVHIKRYRSTDIEVLHSAVVESHAELSEFMAWCTPNYSIDDTATWVNGRAAAWDDNREWSFLIVDLADRILGTCGLHRLDLLNGVGEAGYWVRTSATRQGIATVALQQICRFAFHERGFHRVEILAAVTNLASQRVAEKTGAIREGILRERLSLHGRHVDTVLFSIINRD